MNKNLLISLLLVALIGCKSEGPTYSIDPPFKSIQASYDNFEINPAEAKVIRLPNGSSIDVPENAFVDKDGKPVTGKVTLNYREFHHASDIITSGIPMTATDENGEVQNFESGGMFELKGSANGQEILIAPDKKINVSLASKVEGDFDFYYLEDSENKMRSKASFFSEAHAQNSSSKQYRWKKIYSPSDSISKNAVKRKKDPNAKYFQCHFDTTASPETAMLDTIRWEYAGRNNHEDPFDASQSWVLKETWNRMLVSKPSFYSEILKETSLAKGEYYRGYKLLPDSLGFIVADGPDYSTRYLWNGKEVCRYKGATTLYEWLYNDNTYINKLKTHLILSNEKFEEKLYSIDGTYIKDLGGERLSKFVGNGDKIAHEKVGENVITISALTGKELVKIPFKSGESWNVSKDGNYISLFRDAALLIVDLNGKILNSLPLDKQSDVYSNFSGYKDQCVIKNNKYIMIWDWKKNKTYKSKYSFDLYSHSSAHPTEPLLIERTENNESYIWNWEKDSYKLIGNAEKNSFSFSKKGNYIRSYNEARNGGLYDKDGRQIFNINSSKFTFYIPSVNEDKFLLFVDTTIAQLIDKQGKLIVDFKNYDSLIYRAVYSATGNILTTTKDGTVSLWTDEGKLIQSLNTGKKKIFAYSGFEKNDDRLYIYHSDKNHPLEIIDFKRNKVLAEFDPFYVINRYWVEDNDSGKVVNNYKSILTYDYGNKSNLRLWRITNVELEPDVYRLSFIKEDKNFYTYVHLTDEQLSIVKKYEKILQARFDKEEKRQAVENNLVRSFAINNFGIYNWDKFYKDSLLVHAKLAVDFSGLAHETNDITILLITGKDRNVVVKYYKGTYDKFCFDPNVSNILLAVLSGDKLALFDEESFRKLDVEKIKKEGTLSAKMKIMEGNVSQQMLNDILRKPS